MKKPTIKKTKNGYMIVVDTKKEDCLSYIHINPKGDIHIHSMKNVYKITKTGHHIDMINLDVLK